MLLERDATYGNLSALDLKVNIEGPTIPKDIHLRADKGMLEPVLSSRDFGSGRVAMQKFTQFENRQKRCSFSANALLNFVQLSYHRAWHGFITRLRGH